MIYRKNLYINNLKYLFRRYLTVYSYLKNKDSSKEKNGEKKRTSVLVGKNGLVLLIC